MTRMPVYDHQINEKGIVMSEWYRKSFAPFPLVRWARNAVCIIFGHSTARPDNPSVCRRCGHRMTIRPEVKA